MAEQDLFEIVPLDESWRQWARLLLEREWGGALVVSRGRLIEATLLQGFVALDEGAPVGLATYRLEENGCELVTLNSLLARRGVGSLLLAAVKEAAVVAGCLRLWLITTNDNTPALRFYQQRGFSLKALHKDALTLSRQLKPQIPRLGLHGIPLRDEIELELILGP